MFEVALVEEHCRAEMLEVGAPNVSMHKANPRLQAGHHASYVSGL